MFLYILSGHRKDQNSMFTRRVKLLEGKSVPVRHNIGIRNVNKNSFDSTGINLYSRTIFFGYA